MATESGITAATLSLGQTVVAYTHFMPPIAEVRKSSGDPDMYGDVRMGQVAAGVLSLGIGFILSSMTASNLPVVVSLLVAGVFAALYEIALRGQRPFNPKGATA